MLPFHKVVENDFLEVNETIIRQLHSDVDQVENIGHYILEAGGKRLRPLLVLLAAKSLDYEGKEHINLAAIVEFIHTATLLHDDVVDTSSMRRGRPTANAQFGNAPSVLVGDFLYSRAFQMLVATNSMTIMAIMADATNIISEGEVQQLANIGNSALTENDYLEVIRKKTACLFDAAAHVGAVISNGSAEQCKLLSRYGHHLGIAFQLMDDVLDYQGDAKTLGKNVGDDLAEGKATLPLIYTMRQGTSQQAKVVRHAIENTSCEQLEQVIEVIQTSGGLDYTRHQAEQNAQLAISQLDGLADSPFLGALRELAEFSISRNY